MYNQRKEVYIYIGNSNTVGPYTVNFVSQKYFGICMEGLQ
jgi:hypothetical protein